MVLVTNRKKLGPALQNEEVQMWIRIFCHASHQKKMPCFILQCPKVQNKILFHSLIWKQMMIHSIYWGHFRWMKSQSGLLVQSRQWCGRKLESLNKIHMSKWMTTIPFHTQTLLIPGIRLGWASWNAYPRHLRRVHLSCLQFQMCFDNTMYKEKILMLLITLRLSCCFLWEFIVHQIVKDA